MYNVVQVRMDEYRYCESEEPVNTYNDGPVLVPVKVPASQQSHIQFVSNKLGHHCSIGLKFSVWINLTTPYPQDNVAS